MAMNKVVVAGGGVLGTQIGLMCAYTGHDVTFWLRSESSIGRTQPKIDLYSKAMLDDLAAAKNLIGNPLGALLYPKGLITKWEGITAEQIDALIEQGKKNMTDNVHIELDMAKALIEFLTKKFDISAYKDEYQERLQAAITTKTNGNEIISAVTCNIPNNVINLMEALQRSVELAKNSHVGTA